MFVDGTENQWTIRYDSLESEYGWREMLGRLEESSKRRGTSRGIERNELLMKWGNPGQDDAEA